MGIDSHFYMPDESLQDQAGFILSNFDITEEEVNSIVKEWTERTYIKGEETLSLINLHKIAHKHVLLRTGEYSTYMATFSGE